MPEVRERMTDDRRMTEDRRDRWQRTFEFGLRPIGAYAPEGRGNEAVGNFIWILNLLL